MPFLVCVGDATHRFVSETECSARIRRLCSSARLSMLYHGAGVILEGAADGMAELRAYRLSGAKGGCQSQQHQSHSRRGRHARPWRVHADGCSPQGASPPVLRAPTHSPSSPPNHGPKHAAGFGAQRDRHRMRSTQGGCFALGRKTNRVAACTDGHFVPCVVGLFLCGLSATSQGAACWRGTSPREGRGLAHEMVSPHVAYLAEAGVGLGAAVAGSGMRCAKRPKCALAAKE